MKKEYGKEVLLENLPDFIEGKLDDTDLKEAIHFEISNNSEFKKEYEMFSATIKNFGRYEFTDPPVNYFNNLLPRINGNINVKKEKFGLSKSISLLWKLAIPVAALVLFFFGYKSFFTSNDYIDNIKNDTHTVYQNDYQVSSKPEELTNQEITETGDESDNIYDFENVEKFFSNSSVKKQYTNKNSNETGDILNDLSGNIPDDDVFFSNEDESNYEQIFDDMDKDQQNDILNKIKNSKL
jgi:hypothetical protein